MTRRAVIDLGTNTFQLLVAACDLNQNQITILENRTFAVSLGKGAMDTGFIQEDAKQRAWQALDYFSEILSKYILDHPVTAIGTSIIRNAINGETFLHEISGKYGFKTIKISGSEEADLIFKGVVKSMPNPWTPTSLIMDIGGGSTEFILFKGQETLFKASYEIGGLKMLSLFHQNQEFSVELKQEMQAYILGQISGLMEAIQTYEPTQLIGAAGAFETLFDLEQANSSVEMQQNASAFAKKLSIEIFYQHQRLIENLPIQEREKYPGMKPFRAGILPIAMVEIDLILRNMKNPSLWFSDFSLKEGYFFQSFRNSYDS